MELVWCYHIFAKFIIKNEIDFCREKNKEKQTKTAQENEELFSSLFGHATKKHKSRVKASRFYNN